MKSFDPELPETVEVTSALPGAPHKLQLVHEKARGLPTHKRRPPGEIAAESAATVRQARTSNQAENNLRRGGAEGTSTTGYDTTNRFVLCVVCK